ncbi:MAG: hypothetical protein ACP5NZ_03040 [Nanobdellota archaeon]
MRKYVYEVPVISPRESSFSGSDYNFHAILDGKLGIIARNKEINDNSYNRLKKEGIEIVKSYLSYMDKKYNQMPYQFVEGSWLVHAICVPGDACDLALSEMSMRDFLNEGLKKFDHQRTPIWVDYTGHNVDNINQARCLRELFINWANLVNICFNND